MFTKVIITLNSQLSTLNSQFSILNFQLESFCQIDMIYHYVFV